MAGNKSATESEHVCAGCLCALPFDAFHARSNRPLGRASKCKGCESTRKRDFNLGTVEQRREHYEANREAILDYQRLNSYGLTREQYDAMHRAQGGLCACCEQPERTLNKRGEIKMLAVDHDHSCCPGKKSCGECVRGLLCHSCNVGMGIFGDSPDLLMKAAKYLTARQLVLVGSTEGCG